MGMNISIKKESEDNDYIIYGFSLDSIDTNRLKINKNSLEIEKLSEFGDSYNYVYFKACSYIKKQYLKTGIFPESIICAS